MVFKKDLTPLGKKGTVVKHAGKGAKERPAPSRFARPQSSFPKQAPQPPQGMMPPFGIGLPSDEE